MFWNWYTLDACFLSTTWHVTSAGMFAGSCVSVIALVLLLEFLRRLQREYDRLIQQDCPRDTTAARTSASDTSKHNGRDGTAVCNGSTNSARTNDIEGEEEEEPPHSAVPLLGDWGRSLPPLRTYRHVPTPSQQAVRAGLYTAQFSVAYIVMLLAMYYNGFVIICIFVGAFVGFFVFARDVAGVTDM